MMKSYHFYQVLEYNSFTEFSVRIIFLYLNLAHRLTKILMKYLQLALILVISISCFNCSSSNYPQRSYDYSLNESTLDDESSMEGEEERKILYSAYITLVTKLPDSINSDIKQIAKKYNGYVSEAGTYRSVIRVESSKLNDAIADLSNLGKVQSKKLASEDVTESYYDFQIRLENAEKARDRYLELLAKAENVEAALKVEKELERLNETIDLLKGKMSRIDHLAAYSTITINIREKKKPGLLGYIGLGLYHSVKWLFVRN
ncbi:MAG: hypothetical protein CMO01_20950 [Thalassobius sp.]|nr:hypothetical protein [Thalassovita sp.]